MIVYLNPAIGKVLIMNNNLAQQVNIRHLSWFRALNLLEIQVCYSLCLTASLALTDESRNAFRRENISVWLIK